MGVAGVASTAIVAVRSTPRALHILEDYDQKLREEDEVIRTNWETVKLTWQCYIPAAAIGGSTIACIIAGNSISTKRNAALLSIYSLTDTAFREYKEKVTDTIGAQREQKVRDEIAQDRVTKHPPQSKEVIIVDGKDVLCLDSFSGRYFKSDVETIRRAQNDVNEMILNEMAVSHNEFYERIGLPPNVSGDEFGWNVDNRLEVDFSATITKDDKPCLVIDYRSTPIRQYYKNFR